MKSWSRVLLLAGVLALCSFVSAEAGPWQTDTCYIICDGGQYIAPANSLLECCRGTFKCPDNNPPYAIEWSGGPGEYPTFCGPWAE
jgi:hypothetical protein